MSGSRTGKKPQVGNASLATWKPHEIARYAWKELANGTHIIDGWRIRKTPNLVVVLQNPHLGGWITAFPKVNEMEKLLASHASYELPGSRETRNKGAIGSLLADVHTANLHPETRGVYPNQGIVDIISVYRNHPDADETYPTWKRECLKEALAIARSYNRHMVIMGKNARELSEDAKKVARIEKIKVSRQHGFLAMD